MSDDTRIALPDDGKGKSGKAKEPVFIIAKHFGLGFPPGYRSQEIDVFIRWRNVLWLVKAQTEQYHAFRGHHGHSDPYHGVCAAGSHIVLSNDCFEHYYGILEVARAQGSFGAECALMYFFLRAGSARIGKSICVVLGVSEITHGDIEKLACGLVRFECGNTVNLHFVWKDRDDAAELRVWGKGLADHLEMLRTGNFPLGCETVTPKEVVERAARERVTTEEIRRQLLADGFQENDDGDFVKDNPPIEEGNDESMYAVLARLAEEYHDAGPMYLSPHAWPSFYYVAGGQRFYLNLPGERAWIGYLREKKLIVAIPLNDRKPIVESLPDAPDFLVAMRCIRKEKQETGWSEAGWVGEKSPDEKDKGDVKPEHPPDASAGDATGDAKT